MPRFKLVVDLICMNGHLIWTGPASAYTEHLNDVCEECSDRDNEEDIDVQFFFEPAKSPYYRKGLEKLLSLEGKTCAEGTAKKICSVQPMHFDGIAELLDLLEGEDRKVIVGMILEEWQGGHNENT